MKKTTIYIAALVILAGCASTKPMQLQVTPMGQEPSDAKQQYIYALPQTVLKVGVTYREMQSIPGPYVDYAERYLGIVEVVKQKSTSWKIHDVSVDPFNELDPQHYYSLNVMEGEFSKDALMPLLEQGVVMEGTEPVHEVVNGSGLLSSQYANYIKYVDRGVYTNFEERSETMYKTIVSDTAFVQVPFQRTVVEQKSPSMKAREAADFLLELRLRRFEMLTGEYEVYPDGEAMQAAINKLDELEQSYLSLFTGKTVSRLLKKTWFVVPESGSEASRYPLEMFSEQLGFVPAELMEGLPLEVKIDPLGKTAVPARYFPSADAGAEKNALFIRIPDVASLKIMLGSEVLSDQRISIYQSGALITKPIH